jgi:acetyl esterase
MTQPPDIRSLADLERFLAAQPPAWTVAELRAQAERVAPALNAGPAIPTGPVHGGVAIGPGLTADVIEPPGRGPHPVLVYVHGGGWVASSTRHYRRLASHLAARGFVVVNLEYRLAPETAWPGAVEDARAALRWAAANAGRFDADPRRLVIAGDSCGANIAAGALVAGRVDPGDPAVRAAALLYGVYDARALRGQFRGVPGPGYLSEHGVALMLASYLRGRGHQAAADPTVSPALAAGALPPTLLVCGGDDPLLPQSEAMAAALAAAGAEHETLVVPGVPHGFCQVDPHPPTLPTLDRVAAFLHAHAG